MVQMIAPVAKGPDVVGGGDITRLENTLAPTETTRRRAPATGCPSICIAVALVAFLALPSLPRMSYRHAQPPAAVRIGAGPE